MPTDNAPDSPEVLDALALQCAAADALAGVGIGIETPDGLPAEDAPAAAVDYLTEAQGVVDMVAAMIVGYCPDCAPLWETDTKHRVAAALAPVMEKYGASVGAIPPELLLAIVLVPVLLQTANKISAYNAAKKAVADAQASAKAGIVRPTAKADADPTPEQARHPQEALYRS